MQGKIPSEMSYNMKKREDWEVQWERERESQGVLQLEPKILQPGMSIA